jgi:hypothetical protein
MAHMRISPARGRSVSVGRTRRARSLVAAALVCVLSIAVTARGEEPLRIGKINIVTEDVYTEQEAAKGAAYGLVNTLHVQTRASVIHKMLLFDEGDLYVPSRLAETERNLRKLNFIQSASVVAGEPHDGVVDVTVVTQDAWSTEPGGSVGSAGGGTSGSASVRETNFLGFGKELTVEYASDPDRTGLGFQYEDPALFGNYWRANFGMANNSDGKTSKFLVERPFYSFATTSSVRALASDQTQETRVYENGEVASLFKEETKSYVLSAGRALSASDALAQRLTLGFQFDESKFAPVVGEPSATLPEDREFRYVVADYEFAVNKFRKLNFVSRDLRYEDFRVGTQINLRAGISPTAFGVDETTGLLGFAISRGFEPGPNTLLLARLSWESRIGATNSNEIIGGDFRFIRRTEAAHPHALVGRVNIISGNDLDGEKQFFADGDTGLRAYRLHAFSGDSSLIMNLEERLFLGRELWQVLSPGVAVFVDAGNAANGSDAFDPGNLHFDAGFGLRIGVSRTPRNIFRLDFAYAFDPDPLGNQGWLVSFSGSQAF